MLLYSLKKKRTSFLSVVDYLKEYGVCRRKTSLKYLFLSARNLLLKNPLPNANTWVERISSKMKKNDIYCSLGEFLPYLNFNFHLFFLVRVETVRCSKQYLNKGLDDLLNEVLKLILYSTFSVSFNLNLHSFN